MHSFANARCEARIQLEPGITELVDRLADARFAPDAQATVTIPLDPYGYGWFDARREGQRAAP